MIIKDIKILDESFQVRDHMNVVVEDGKFLSITKGMPEPEGREVIDGNGKFMMPAFYNTHCHVPMTLLRGYGEGLPLQRWLQERIFPFEAKFSPEYKYWGAKLGRWNWLSPDVCPFRICTSILSTTAGPSMRLE